jgi:tubulin epsilon
MPRELITVQVGQCGNQVAMRFWDLALQEHARYNKSGLYDDPLSSFFRNVDTRYSEPVDIAVGRPISNLRARAVVIDMEEGVINNMLRSDLGELFDARQLISDVSGAGNNWAHGHYGYGQQYHDEILDKVRYSAEHCDSLQSFFLMHSMGGGTGSGVGTYTLELLADNFPDVFRFSTVVFPEDDVVTGPYNSVLAMSVLTEHADCVLPVDNEALIGMLQMIEESKRKGKKEVKNDLAEPNDKKEAFAKMNNIIAHMLNNLTCSMRFEGMLNVDLNEITMNLVPFPKMPYLVSSISPLYSILDVKMEPRRLDQIFSDVIDKDFQLLKVDPKHSTYLACGLILRGDAKISDIHRNINRIKSDMNMISWNQEGYKIGLCNTPPVGMPYSLLCLSNNSCITTAFSNLKQKFLKLYKRKANVHHYTNFMEKERFDQALESLEEVSGRYTNLETPKNNQARIKPLI